MDSPSGLVQVLSELGELAVQRGIAFAAGLGASMDDLDPTELPTRVAGMADDALGQGKANTDFVVSLVRSEVDRAVGRMGFVREEELAAVRKHVARLEEALTSLVGAGASVASEAARAAKKAPAKKAPAKKAPAKKAPANKAPANKSAGAAE